MEQLTFLRTRLGQPPGHECFSAGFREISAASKWTCNNTTNKKSRVLLSRGFQSIPIPEIVVGDTFGVMVTTLLLFLVSADIRVYYSFLPRAISSPSLPSNNSKRAFEQI